MRRLMQRVLRRVMRAALADLIQEITEVKRGVLAIQGQLAAVISDLSRELTEIKGGVSATQGQLGDTWAHTLAMRNEIANLILELAETKGGVSAIQGQLGDTWAHTLAMRNEIADLILELAETKGGVSATQGQLGDTWAHTLAMRNEIANLILELAETKGGVSAMQGQLGDTWSYVLAMTKEIAGSHQELATASGGISAIQAQLGETAAAMTRLVAERKEQNGQIRQLPHLLDAVAARCLTANVATAAQPDDNRGLASYYARLAGLVAQHWVRQCRLPVDPHPSDDMTLDYSVHSGVYVRGNEAEIDPREAFLPWRQLWSDPDCGVLLVLGQSNAGNHGETPYASREEVYSLDFLRMRCFRAADPLAGASGNGGSVWSRLGDMLVENGVWRRVLFIPLAFGGSFIAQWTPGGPMQRRTALALRRLREELGQSLLPCTAVLWQQGEAEANHSQMSALDYKMHFHDVVADLRANGVFAPVFVARTTICEGSFHPHNNHTEIRSAQVTLPDPSVGILPGPDTDSIGLDGRYDGCHFSDAGLRRCAELWLDVLRRRRDLLQKISMLG